MRILKDKRAILMLLLISAILAFFWLGSRYPDLGEKAGMGAEMELGGISFDVVRDTNLIESRWEKLFYTVINWVDGNKKGMLFGLFLAAAFMSLLTLLGRKGFEHWWGNTLLGVAIGAPLGVCVNCAAPIAKGLRSGGAKPETALAAMLSSPTLNVVILTMTFTLLPWYMGTLKVLLTFFLILVGVPLLCRFFVYNKDAEPAAICDDVDLNCPQENSQNTWRPAFRWLAATYLRKLWEIVWKTVPLMLLAGLLGAVLVTFFPWKDLLKAMPGAGEYAQFAGLMIGLALLGTFLPVPIAFDIVIVVILVSAGFKEHYAMILLFTLGSYSIYSQLIVNRMFSFAAGATLFLMVCGTGIVAGGATYYIAKWDHHQQEAKLIAGIKGLADRPFVRPELPEIPVIDDAELNHLLTQNKIQWTALDSPEGISIERAPFAEKPKANATTLFSKMSGVDFGLDVPFHFDANEFIWQFAQHTRSITSGDVHNDGYTDLVIPLDNFQGGLALFANIGGKRFVRQEVPLGPLSQKHIRCVALVDLNNDGWLDLFFATHLDGVQACYNENGRFRSKPVPIHQRELAHAQAVTFGDIDENGLLDIVLGYWAIGWPMSDTEIPEACRNVILFQDTIGNFREVPLPAEPGYTWSALLSDFNQDGHLDLLTANDWYRPDFFYIGDGTGNLTLVKDAKKTFQRTPFTTMSVTTADLDNDLEFEIFHAAFAKGADNRQFNRKHGKIVSELEKTALSDREKEAQSRLPALTQARNLVMAKKEAAALKLFPGDQTAQDAIHRLSLYHRLRRDPESTLWPMVPTEPPFLSEGIKRFRNPPMYSRSEKDIETGIEQLNSYSTLLFKHEGGHYVDEAGLRGLNVTGWTWNAKFADLDNDTWQDLYCANGTMWNRYRDNNLYFRNTGNGQFQENTEASGLTDHPVTFSYTYIDFDSDGDLDIISNPNCGEVRVFRNQLNKGNSIRIQLRDSQGNRFGLGAKVVVSHSGVQQIREIQQGGGFLSFGAADAHFGLSNSSALDKIEVSWPGGEKTTLSGPIAGNGFIRIYRN